LGKEKAIFTPRGDNGAGELAVLGEGKGTASKSGKPRHITVLEDNYLKLTS
jgi:hypothetical protein